MVVQNGKETFGTPCIYIRTSHISKIAALCINHKGTSHLRKDHNKAAIIQK